MSNKLQTINPAGASLLEMRADAERFPRLCNIPVDQAYAQMIPIITQAFMYKGHHADDTTIKFIATTLVDELLADRQYGAGNISIGEIRYVIKRAILETDIPAISVSTLYRVVLDYAKGEGNDLERQIRMRKTIPSAPVNAMMDSFAGAMAKTHKIK
jgi:hypothetical protein